MDQDGTLGRVMDLIEKSVLFTESMRKNGSWTHLATVFAALRPVRI